MNKIQLPKDIKKQAVQEIKKYFSSERDEEMGDLSAELVLDFFLEEIGPYVYNQAIKDAHSYIDEKVEDMFGLEKDVRR